MAETPEIIYGRLLESVHVSGYSMERACMALEYLLGDGQWKTVGPRFDNIDAFLKSIDLSQFKIAVDRRKKLAKRLEELQATQRATAKALGVDVSTVNRDVANATKRSPKPSETPEKSEAPVANATRPNPMSIPGGDAARTAEKQVTKAYDKALLYGHDEGDEWYTPKWLFDSLGLTFSIDVCAPEDREYVSTPAKRFFTPKDNGLSHTWSGTVWCNPPYSDPEPWALRCIEHNNGLLLTHVPMNAEWCSHVWEACAGLRLFQAIEFVRSDGDCQRPGYWIQLAAFGEKAANALSKMMTPPEVASNPRRVPSPMWIRYEQ